MLHKKKGVSVYQIVFLILCDNIKSHSDNNQGGFLDVCEENIHERHLIKAKKTLKV